MFRFFPSVVLFSCLFALLFATGCGGTHISTGQPAASMPTVAVTPQPASVASGSSSMLTVSAANATSVAVTGSDGSSYTLQGGGGAQAVTPAKTTVYTATASGPGGSATAQATVTVTGAIAPAPTVSIAGAPASISAGSSSTLTVAAANATAVTVTGTDGSSYTLPATGGFQIVSPAATTTYTANATGAGGKTTASATVTVVPAPVPAPSVNITPDPASIAQSGSTILKVTATGATQILVTGSDGSSNKLPGMGGTLSVSPSVTTIYTATATGPGGSSSNTATVTVTVTPNPAPSVSIAAAPNSITVSNSSLLTVTAANATQVTIAGSDSSSYQLPASGGTQPVSPKATTIYTVTATGPGGTASKSATVTVSANPAPSLSFNANPPSISTGGSSTLIADATNATTVTIKGSDGESYTLASSHASQPVSPAATTTYTATATGPGGTTAQNATVTVTAVPAPTATVSASPMTITHGHSATLTVTPTNATQVTIKGDDGTSTTYPVPTGAGPQVITQTVSPAGNTTYTVAVTGSGGNATYTVTVTVTGTGTVQDVDHVIFMLQENHSFDNYFGMLNPYRIANKWNIGADGTNYAVDGIDDKLTTANQDDEGDTFPLFKLTSTCVDDESSAWLESYGDINRYDFTVNRAMKMDGFVHTAEGFAKSCSQPNTHCSGSYTDLTGQRAMGYYDGSTLNYYYYMASEFALSDRWFTPVSSKSIDNRIATFTGGTTQGLTADPGNDDHQGQLAIPTIFGELEQANVSWKIYYTVTQGECTDIDDCPKTGNARYPGTNFSALAESYKYLHQPSTEEAADGCSAPTVSSNNPITGDSTGSFCVDPTHIAPLSQYYLDVKNGTLPAYAFIEAGYGNNDEHPGSGQSVLAGQAEVAKVVNAFMGSPSWNDSIFFFSYDEAGGPYDHVPPVPGRSNDNTDAMVGAASTATDIPVLQIPTTPGAAPVPGAIAVNADGYNPCQPPTAGTATLHCDLSTNSPGANPADAPAQQGFAAQLGFRVPNMVISPFTRAHYVSHTPMDHTAVIRFIENRFLGANAHLTARDAAQPNLLDFFDFQNPPWVTPPTPPVALSDPSSCHPTSFTP